MSLYEQRIAYPYQLSCVTMHGLKDLTKGPFANLSENYIVFHRGLNATAKSVTYSGYFYALD